MSKVKYIFIVAIIITNLNVISFADEVSTEVLNERINHVDKLLNEKIDGSEKVLNEKINKVEESLTDTTEELNKSKEQVDSNKDKSMENENRINVIVLGASFLGLTSVLILVSLFVYTKREVDKRLKKLLDEKNNSLENAVNSYSEESLIRKETKVLVFNETGNNDLRDVLGKFFEHRNLNYKNFIEINQVIREVENNIDLIKNNDVIIFGYKVEEVEDITNKIEEIIKDRLPDKTMLYFYYAPNKKIIKYQKLDDVLVNTANSKVTIYTNLMNLLKYKRNILN